MSLKDDLIKHRIFLQRLAGTEFENIKDFLNNLEKIVKREIANGTNLAELKTILRNSMKDLSSTSIENLTDIAEYESQFLINLYNKYFDSDIQEISREDLKQVLLDTNMGINNVKIQNGELVINEDSYNKSLLTAYNQFGQRKSDELIQIIKDAKTNGLDEATLINNIQERISGLQTTQAKVLAGTVINYTSNAIKETIADNNSDIIKQEVWVSLLEPNTCGYCEDQDGTVYDVGDAPDCPAHWNCNCEVVPYDE